FVVSLAWGYFTLVRLNGVDGSISGDLQYRWKPTAEETFLAEISAVKSTPEEVPEKKSMLDELALQPGDWTCFRGQNRDGRLAGVLLATDWNAHPPRLV